MYQFAHFFHEMFAPKNKALVVSQNSWNEEVNEWMKWLTWSQVTLFDQGCPKSKWYANGSNNLIFAFDASLHRIFLRFFFIECKIL